MPVDNSTARLAEIVRNHRDELVTAWVRSQSQALSGERIRSGELTDQCCEFVDLMLRALETGRSDFAGDEWTTLEGLLSDISKGRTQKGFSSSETATFVYSLKGPLFDSIRSDLGRNPNELVDVTLQASEILDRLGLYTVESFQRTREAIILRQQQDMLELSTPVVKLWDGILALPVIGTLDSARSQVIMESLLTEIVASGADIAIIDITGVPTVDTLTAQHLLKTVTAARLMGADCIISGIRPQIAQTIVHLGVDLNSIVTKASLATAFSMALDRKKLKVVSAKTNAGSKQDDRA